MSLWFIPSACSLGRSIVAASMNGCLASFFMTTSSSDFRPQRSAVFSSPSFTSRSFGTRTVALSSL